MASSRGKLFVTRIGLPRCTANRPGAARLMKQGSKGAPVRKLNSAGVRRNQACRPSSVTATRSRPRCRSISIGDHLVLTEAPANLKRGVERLPHFQRVGSKVFTNLIADAIHPGIGLCHGDDRQSCGHCPVHQEAAHLPVAAVAGHDDDAMAFGEQTLEERVAFAGRSNNASASSSMRRSRRRKSMLSHAYARKVASARRCRSPFGLIGKDRAEVVGDRRAARVHQPPCEPRAHVPDRVGHLARQPAHAVIRRAENQAVIQAVRASTGEGTGIPPVCFAPAAFVDGSEALEESIGTPPGNSVRVVSRNGRSLLGRPLYTAVIGTLRHGRRAAAP